MTKPEKYLVLSRRNVIALYNRIIEDQINSGSTNATIVLKCQMASNKHPGQLQYTDEYRLENYSYWPSEDIEGDNFTEIDSKNNAVFEALEYLEAV